MYDSVISKIKNTSGNLLDGMPELKKLSYKFDNYIIVVTVDSYGRFVNIDSIQLQKLPFGTYSFDRTASFDIDYDELYADLGQDD